MDKCPNHGSVCTHSLAAQNHSFKYHSCAHSSCLDPAVQTSPLSSRLSSSCPCDIPAWFQKLSQTPHIPGTQSPPLPASQSAPPHRPFPRKLVTQFSVCPGQTLASSSCLKPHVTPPANLLAPPPDVCRIHPPVATSTSTAATLVEAISCWFL